MKKLSTLLLILVLAVSTACGSVSKTAYNGLTGLKGVYVASNDVRNAYCRPKPVKPPVCVASYAPLATGYHILAEGTRLLEIYVVNKDKGTGDLLIAITAEIPHVIGEIIAAVGDIKAATGTSPPAPVAAPAN